jgi:four helix bundle protein
MDNKEFAKKLEVRTRQLAVSIIKISGSLPESPEGKVIRNQLTKAGTSIGANYHEANRARSKPDFINRMKICESETSEAIYWMTIIEELKWISPVETVPVIKELYELIAIFAQTGKTLNQKKVS